MFKLLSEFLIWNEKNVVSRAYDWTIWFSVAQVASWLDVICGLNKVDPLKDWNSIWIILSYAEKLVDVWLCCDLVTSKKSSAGVILYREKKNVLSAV